MIFNFKASHFKTNLLEVNFPATQLLDLIPWDVVIENDHAAVFFRLTSVTIPRLVSDMASRTASGVIMPLY